MQSLARHACPTASQHQSMRDSVTPQSTVKQREHNLDEGHTGNRQSQTLAMDGTRPSIVTRARATNSPK